MSVHGQMVIPIKARGGAPEYRRETRVHTPGSAGVPQLSDAAGRLAVEGYRAENAANAGTAQALARLGGAVDNAVKVGAKAYQDYQAALAQNAYNQYEADEIRLKAELNTLQGQNALGDDGVMARLGRWREEAREKYAGKLSPIARDLFHRNIRKLDAATDAWVIGKQDRENINFQNTVSEGSILNARNLALENPGDEAAFANAMGIIKAEYERMGARSGWDEGFRDAKFAEAREKLAFDRAAALINAGQLEAAERVIGGSLSPTGIGSLAMGHESGGNPGAISRDTGGSKSYGLFQFNNRGGKGTANSFVAALKTTHPALYEALGGGKYAVGSEEFDKAFRAAANGPLRAEMVQAQREHLESQYLRPVERLLKDSELFAAFGDNAAMREVMLSTAIQHGPAGANRILREAWGMVDKGADKQAQLEQLITATYELRGRPGEFRTVLAELKDDAARERFLSGMRNNRYAKEKEQALALARAGAGSGGLLTPAQRAQLQGKIDHARREQAQEAGLTAQNFDNHLEYGVETGDFTAAKKDVAALRSLGFASEAAELSGRLELARTVHGALNDVSDLPLAEQAAAVHAQLDSMVTPDNAKAATAMRDNVVRALAQKQATFIKDPAASVAALPPMQGEMPPQERVRRSLELQERMGAGLAFEPRVLPVEQARQLKAAYDKLDAPVSRVAWLSELNKTYGPYARQALHEMQVPEQVVTLLPVLGVMNEKSMGLALTALEVKDGDIPGLDKDAKQAAVDAAAKNRLLKDVLALSRAFPANEDMRRFGQGMETMLTNYVKLGGNLADFDKAFESAASGECFLMLPRNAGYSVDDVVDATRDVREDLREKLLAGVPPDTQQGRIAHANLSGLIERGVFVSDESGTKVTLIDPQHGRPVLYGDGTPMSFDIAGIVKSRTGRKVRQLYKFAEDGLEALASLEVKP